MAYNKSKSVEAAQKLLNQGKVTQAISEYQQILKFEPRDQVTLMTVGELYIRQGETFQAIDYFERLAQIFVGDGFLTKAIAVYKRIAKLAPEEIRPLEKLADLYVQQGVMSEARPLFLQLAEIHLKNNRQPEAVGLLKKLLLAEPDNLRIQVRLADLYQAMGQSREAIDTYVSAAQRAIARGDHAECERLADKALKLEAHNLAALTVKARSATAQGNVAGSMAILEQVPDLQKGGEQTELLLDLYLKNAKWEPATALALRVFEADEKNFGPVQKLIEALLESGQGEKAMAILEKSRIPMIDAGDHEIVGRLLNELVARLPGRVEPLEWLVDTYGRTSDSFRLPDALAQLSDALVATKQFDRAKQVCEQLVDREPESDSAKRKLNDVLRKMGLLAAGPESAAPEIHAVELPKTPAPKVRPDLPSPQPVAAAKPKAPAEAPLDEETEKFIAQSLTDVDLFASYGLTQKAIGLLEAILRRAPRHTPTLEKLLDFVLGAGDDRRTAELASHLEQIHQERGDTRSAERFGELRRRFQRAAGLTDDELTPAPAAISGAPEAAPQGAAELPPLAELQVAPDAPAAQQPATEVSASQASAGPEMHEVDLSDEWASLLGGSLESESAPANVAPMPTAATPETISEPAPRQVHGAHGEESEEFSVPVTEAPLAESGIDAKSPADVPGEIEEFAISEEVPTPAASGANETHAPAWSVDAAESSEFEISEAVSDATTAGSEFADISAELPGTAEPAYTLPEPAAEIREEFPPATEELPAADLHARESLSPGTDLAEAPPQTPAEATASDDHAETKESAQQPDVHVGEAPLELELDEDYELVLAPEALVPAHEQKPPETPVGVSEPATPEPVHAASESLTTDEFLADLASEMGEAGIGDLSQVPAEPFAAEPLELNSNGQAPTGSGESAPLKEVFDEFRAELGEMGSEGEDLETHYNLGVAYREMGLLEEAISEFQKVAQACDRGRPFRYTMQCCTLLGLAFIEKGQPGIAAIWYERALKTPGLGPDSVLALRYDLGVAQESAGDHEAALKSFSHVYAMNIDYRDVAERISVLQKTSR
jgi:tetratricopeptide (TPR) repeat protein